MKSYDPFWENVPKVGKTTIEIRLKLAIILFLAKNYISLITYHSFTIV